jgi:hypothetical protein
MNRSYLGKCFGVLKEFYTYNGNKIYLSRFYCCTGLLKVIDVTNDKQNNYYDKFV